MPYVPLPYGVNSLTVQAPFEVPYQDFNRNTGALVSTGTLVGPSGKSERSIATRTVSKGKPITILGKKWSPTRPFTRTALLVLPQGGTTRCQVYVSGNYRRRVCNGPEWIVGPGLRGYTFQSGITAAWDSNTRNRVNTELLLKVGKRQVNYGESLAESRETVKMLAGTVSSLARAVLAARRGRWDQVAKHLGVQRKKLRDGASASEKWLAYQYGWLPMMNDVYDSYELFKKGLRQGPQVFSAVRNLRSTEREHTVRGDFAEVIAGQTEVCHTAKVWYRLADNDLNSLHQLGLINPLEVAWAIVPYSFVVDWFLPVGSVLEALSARMGVTFVDGYYGKRVVSNYVARQYRSPSGTTTFYGSTWTCKTEGFKYWRTKMSSLPYPGLYIKSPFSTSHVTSALALLRQLWR